MKAKLDFWSASVALFVAFTVSYVLCVAGDLIFGWTMYQVWAPLMPGFTWPVTAGGFIIGLLWIVGYSLYLAALLVWPYNYWVSRGASDGKQA